MNTRFNVICLIILLSFSTSACGMKRALTLPKKDADKTASIQVQQQETKELYKELADADSIDVLKR